ncbi:MAG TPA: thioredoxin domain-containing protein [Thermoanaerobaculia bacterium]|nr:thioredoxin domain-containing protein [Thermoanaerobaculia bacterium]
MANRLAFEKSPYLLQHADNPVDWLPWGDEAFGRARAEDKPIFLSIGYSTCHWCHVMERESFENEAIAELLNRYFVSIKVDREERPDVDDVYMTAVQTMTGSGGWPLSLFLTPEGRPFYGGTYFPPDDRYGRPGFPSLLRAISDAWKIRRRELEESAVRLVEHLDAAAPAAASGEEIGRAVLDKVARAFTAEFDPQHGGFGSAPKFPPAMRLELLIRQFLRTGDPKAREMVETTLEKMAAGGLYDHIGGGFHRYSTDAKWLVPHFEKMLYDNALLARVYLLAYRAFGNADFARVARETLDYLLAEMTPGSREGGSTPAGGFFAAQDADSAGEEGTFYVWDPESLEAAVGAEAAPIVAARYGVTEAGNFENEKTVLSIVNSVAGLAAQFSLSEGRVQEILREARAKMYEARSRREPPLTDTKLLTDWSALAISAFALAARLLAEPRYEAAARRAADRILSNCRVGGDLLHREKDGAAEISGFASDYAFFVQALLDLYEATFEPRDFRAAVELQNEMDERFADPRGGYFLAAEGHGRLIVRPREFFDGATPSSNSVAAMNLLRLSTFTGDASYRDRAESIFSAFAGYLDRAPAAFPQLLCALDYREDEPREVVLSGEMGRPDFESLRAAAFGSRRVNRVLAHADAAESLADVMPLVAKRGSSGGAAAAWVCRNFACLRPTSDPAELAVALDA